MMRYVNDGPEWSHEIAFDLRAAILHCQRTCGELTPAHLVMLAIGFDLPLWTVCEAAEAVRVVPAGAYHRLMRQDMSDAIRAGARMLGVAMN